MLDTLERNSVWSVVVNGWSQLALQLDTPPLTVSVLRKDLLLEKKSHSEVVLELLTVWKSRNAGNATLGKLVGALRNCGWNEFAGKKQ